MDDSSSATATVVAPALGGDFETELHSLRERVEAALGETLALCRAELVAEAPEAAELVDEVIRLVGSGGKRLRPALVVAGYQACGGADFEAVSPLAQAAELLHTYLLIHDDIMDHAELRRGAPTVHAALRERHRSAGWPGDSAEHGRALAILAGDLAATWAADLAHRARGARPADAAAVARTWAQMSSEVIAGQYLEMRLPLSARRGERPSEDDLLNVLRLKSGRYSVERPIELGARLAGAAPATLAGLAAYGRAVGEAFQLQDDLLGLFGDPADTGKSVGGDFSEGKYTLLLHRALEGSAENDRQWLLARLGESDLTTDELQRALDRIRATGAREEIEALVEARFDAALAALEATDLTATGRTFFTGLVAFLRERDR
jgi:geranylgeranyl diphosphate synthase type I